MIKKSKKDNKHPKYIGTGSYEFQKKLPERDNYMIYDPLPGDGRYDEQISLGEGIEHSSRIRVPSLKRKAAWKRFYKLYPHLKGKKSITGCSSCYGKDIDGKYYQTIQNASTIKLKKVKK